MQYICAVKFDLSLLNLNADIHNDSSYWMNCKYEYIILICLKSLILYTNNF